MLQSMGVKIKNSNNKIHIEPASEIDPISLTIPGDISSAAPWLVLGACHPNAEIYIEKVGVNSTRTGLLDILKRMGAQLEIENISEPESEQIANLSIRSSTLKSTIIEKEEIPRAIDELPLIALLGCYAEGKTIVRDAEELRVKESDRIESIVNTLRAMGAEIYTTKDGFVVEGGSSLKGSVLDGKMDHRIGILAAIAGSLVKDKTSVINDAVSISYPTFWNVLKDVAEVTE
jgi:3-phosphoshikimate 1-carboxyvinyltransferase